MNESRSIEIMEGVEWTRAGSMPLQCRAELSFGS